MGEPHVHTWSLTARICETCGMLAEWEEDGLLTPTPRTAAQMKRRRRTLKYYDREPDNG